MAQNNLQRVFRLDIAYDGTEFLGFQEQKEGKTIQSQLQDALKKIFKQPITLYGSGRTDAGVHALQQVISFLAPSSIPLQGLKRALNALLPLTIRVLKVQEENSSFHARFSPKRRTYVYLVYNHEICPPFLHRYVHWIKHPLRIKKIKKALSYLQGEHDFKAFCEKEKEKPSYVRTLYTLKLKKKGPFIMISIQGNGFLRRMVRVIVGTALSIGSYDNIKPSIIKDILHSKKRHTNPFATAPAKGLFLYQVEFKKQGWQSFFKKTCPLKAIFKFI